MNHFDWINLLLQLLTVALSSIGAHYGAKNGSNTEK